MRKAALIIGLIIVLITSVLGGSLSVYANVSQTLTATNGTAPGSVQVSGTGWTKGVGVKIYMDTEDDAHFMTIAVPSIQSTSKTKGLSVTQFSVTLSVGPTSLGTHKIIAVQDATTLEAFFTLTSVQQVDDRIFAILLGIQTDIATINSNISDIEEEIEYIHHDIHEIQREMAEFDSDQGCFYARDNKFDGFNASLAQLDYPGHLVYRYRSIRHVSLTIGVEGSIPTENFVEVLVAFGHHEIMSPADGPIPFKTITEDGIYTYEFDAEKWSIHPEHGDQEYKILWSVTTLANDSGDRAPREEE